MNYLKSLQYRIINVNVPKAMEYKITDYNKKFRSVTKAEKFFSLQDFQNRGPEVIAQEFKTSKMKHLELTKSFILY